MPETTPLIKAALNLRVGAGFDVYDLHGVRSSGFCFSQKETAALFFQSRRKIA